MPPEAAALSAAALAFLAAAALACFWAYRIGGQQAPASSCAAAAEPSPSPSPSAEEGPVAGALLAGGSLMMVPLVVSIKRVEDQERNSA